MIQFMQNNKKKQKPYLLKFHTTGNYLSTNKKLIKIYKM